MLQRQGFTLIEIVIVLLIISIVAAISFPNFTPTTEQARSLNAQNNLLAIYTAEKDYFNNNGNFALSGTGSLSAISTTFGLNILDDGTYNYSCTPSTCTATRTTPFQGVVLTLSLTQPVQLTGGSPNPVCTSSSSPTHLNWCPV